jgi:hypothetical protein
MGTNRRAAVLGLLFAAAAEAGLAVEPAPAAPPEEIEIRVLSPRGTGIPGAWIRPVRQRGDAWFERETGPGGSVRMEVEELSRLGEICVGAPGCRARHLRAAEVLRSAEGGVATIRIAFVNRIAVRVVDEDGAPRPGSRVEGRIAALPGERRAPRPTRGPRPGTGPAPRGVPRSPVERIADASGVAQFLGLDEGDWEFDVATPGLERVSRTAAPVRGSSDHEVRLVVRPEQRLRARLVDLAGDPLAGATVRRHPPRDPARPEEAVAETDADGRFSLRATDREGAFRLEVLLADGRASTLERITRSPEERTWTLDLAPAGGEAPSLRGRVVGATGRPVRAALRVRSEAEPPGESPGPTAWTRPDGTFEVYRLPPGPYRVSAWFVGAAGILGSKNPWSDAGTITLPADGVVLRLPIGDPISGRLLDAAGEPAPGVLLRADLLGGTDSESAAPAASQRTGGPAGRDLSRPEGLAWSGAGGTFLFENLSPGRYRVTAVSGVPAGTAAGIGDGDSVPCGTEGVILRLRPVSKGAPDDAPPPSEGR